MSYSLYRITQKSTGKVYVGITANMRQRWYNHCSNGRLQKTRSSSPLYVAMRACGIEDFDLTVCSVYDSREEALAAEAAMVDKLRTTDPEFGFNVEPGGSAADAKRGRPRPPEVCRKIGDAHIGKKHSPEHIAKCLAARAGYRPSEATKEKMRQAALGRVISDEQRKKISATMTGRKLPESVKAAIGAAHVGRKNTEETKEKMRQAAYRRIERQRGSAAKGY